MFHGLLEARGRAVDRSSPSSGVSMIKQAGVVCGVLGGEVFPEGEHDSGVDERTGSPALPSLCFAVDDSIEQFVRELGIFESGEHAGSKDVEQVGAHLATRTFSGIRRAD